MNPVALKSLGNKLFGTADPIGAAPLLANGINAGLLQTFQWTDSGDGMISLRALVNNRDVTMGRRCRLRDFESMDALTDQPGGCR